MRDEAHTLHGYDARSDRGDRAAAVRFLLSRARARAALISAAGLGLDPARRIDHAGDDSLRASSAITRS